MTRKGRDLEKLVAIIERALADNPETVVVESPKYLDDNSAGISREFDVVITSQQGPRTLLVGIECKDWKVPVDVLEVDGFITKARDCGVGRAIMVSSHGFTRAALVKAKSKSVDCLDLEKVESFPWLEARFFQLRYKKVIKDEWSIGVDAVAGTDLQEFHLYHKSGAEITSQILKRENLFPKLDALPFDEPYNQERELRVTFSATGCYAQRPGSDVSFPITEIHVDLRYLHVVEPLPLDLHTYIDKNTGKKLTDAAVANVSAPGFAGKLAIIYDKEKGGSVVFSVEKGNRSGKK